MWRPKAHWLEPQLQKLVFNDPSFTVLRFLGQRSLTVEDIDKLAQALDGNTKLRELNLRGIHLNREGVRKIALVLQGRTGIQCLNVSINTFGSGGAALLADALRVNTTLISLELTGTHICPEGAAALGLALKCNTALQQLSMGKNEIGDDGMRFLTDALAHEIPLAELDVHSCAVTSEGITRLAEALSRNTTLKKLYINGNKIGDAGAERLAQMLHHNSSLAVLDLGSGEIGSLGAASLAEGLAGNAALTHLRLACNMIGTDGAKKFVEVIAASNTTIQEVGLECNPIDSACTSYLEDLLECNVARHEGRPPRKAMPETQAAVESGLQGISTTRREHVEEPRAQESKCGKSERKDKLVSEVLADLGIGALPSHGGVVKQHHIKPPVVAATSRETCGLVSRDTLIEDMLAELGDDSRGRPARRSGYPGGQAPVALR